jgi:hypothetical protein
MKYFRNNVKIDEFYKFQEDLNNFQIEFENLKNNIRKVRIFFLLF